MFYGIPLTQLGEEAPPCQDPVTLHGSLTSPQLMITKLLPDTTYNISIAAFSQFAAGPPRTCRFHTDITGQRSQTS